MPLKATLAELLETYELREIFDALGDLCAEWKAQQPPPPPKPKGDLEEYRKGSFWGF